MNTRNETSLMESVKTRTRILIKKHNLLDVNISILAKPLTPEEAIGTPGRRDFPIIEGKERVVEAQILGAKGHAYTDSPKEFIGTLRSVLGLDTSSNHNRAIFIASINAVLRYLDLAEGTVHCKDEEPEKCGAEIAKHVLDKWGKVKIGLVGMNPAIAEALVETFDADNIKINDLNAQTIGKTKFGVEVWNGKTMTEELVKQSDVVLITGTTMVNNSFGGIYNYLTKYGKDYLVYGVTCAGICNLMKLNRICPYGRNE